MSLPKVFLFVLTDAAQRIINTWHHDEVCADFIDFVIIIDAVDLLIGQSVNRREEFVKKVQTFFYFIFERIQLKIIWQIIVYII